MLYTNEFKQFLDELKSETRPGVNISAPDVLLKILVKYHSNKFVEDISLVMFFNKYFKNEEFFGNLMDDLISYQQEYSSSMPSGENYTFDRNYPMDVLLIEALKKGKEHSDKRPRSVVPFSIFSSYHFLIGIVSVDKNIEKIFKRHGITRMNIYEVEEDNRELYNSIDNLVSSIMDSKPDSKNFVDDVIDRFFSKRSDSSEENNNDLETNNDFDNPNTVSEFLESMGFPSGTSNEKTSGKKKSKTPMLDKYAKNLLEENLDPIYGRENELSQLLEILSCKKKNNAILIGEAGVGKTSVVELFAQKIKSQDVPREYINKKIYSLDLNSMVAGTKYRGQYEERLQGIIDEVINNKDVIIFIDEIHNLIGNGSSDGGSGDAANILKPYLSRGKFRCIGSTTFKEFRKFIESDAALNRRFQKIIIEEPTAEETKDILKRIKGVYEKHHNVIYPKEVIDACVDLSGRYLYSSRFPDKAIDALDLSGSLCRLVNSKSNTEDYKNLEKELEETINKKNDAVIHEVFEDALVYKEREDELYKSLNNTKPNVLKVSIEDVYQAIGKRSGVPIDTIGSSDLEKLRRLNAILNKEVIGQEKAVKEIVMNLQKNSLSIRDESKPVSLLFTGPTGCGKTYLCKKLAEEFFGSKDSLIRFDMGEFEEKHSISKLIGATASYVGYNDEPLFDKIRHKPYSVVLFDEIEKAAPEIFQVFLNILDEGYVTLGNGVKVDFRHCIIIFTGNIGTKELALFGNGVGYSSKSNGEVIDESRKDSIIQKAIEKTFAPEFINRLSKIVIFSSLGNQEMLKIIDLELSKLSKRLKSSKISLKVGKALKEHIISLCNLNYGARDLQRKISELIEEKICEKLLEPDIKNGKKVFSFDYKDDLIVVDVK